MQKPIMNVSLEEWYHLASIKLYLIDQYDTVKDKPFDTEYHRIFTMNSMAKRSDVSIALDIFRYFASKLHIRFFDSELYIAAIRPAVANQFIEYLIELMTSNPNPDNTIFNPNKIHLTDAFYYPRANTIQQMFETMMDIKFPIIQRYKELKEKTLEIASEWFTLLELDSDSLTDNKESEISKQSDNAPVTSEPKPFTMQEKDQISFPTVQDLKDAGVIL